MRAFAISLLSSTLWVLPAAVHAQDNSAPQGNAVAHHDADAGATPFAVAAIGEDRLQAIAGREDTTQIAQADQFSGVAGNSVGDNSVTGDARIADNAFQNMSGLSILNVNTGNNVAINASMNVNVSISPAP